jgi:hypothetical protein
MLAAAAGCTQASTGSRGTATPTNLDAFDPAGYRDLWKGDMSLDGLSFAGVSDADWEKDVGALRESGLNKLPESQRKQLLQGAIKAYLLSIENTTRRISVDGLGASDVHETYATDPDLFTALHTRQQSSAGIISDWPDLVRAEPGKHESVNIIETQGGTTITEEFRRDADEQYQCNASQQDAGLAFAESSYYARLIAVVTANPVGTQMVAGRQTYVLESDFGEGKLRTFLDERTLFPLRYEVPPVAGVSPGKQLQPRMTVDITGFNNVAKISPPNVTCTDSS